MPNHAMPRMSTELTLFLAALSVVLVYPIISLIAAHRLKAQIRKLAAEHCPKCGEVFGASIIRSTRELRGFIDPAPPGPLLLVVCPHCHAALKYCDGFYVSSSIQRDAQPASGGNR